MKLKVKIKGKEENRFIKKALRRNIKWVESIDPLEAEARKDIEAMKRVLDFYGD